MIVPEVLKRFCSSNFAFAVRAVGFLGDHASVIGPNDGTQKSRHENFVPRSKSKKGWVQSMGEV